MKMIKLLVITAIVFFINSCEKEKNDMTVVDLRFDISYVDNTGIDLLDPAQENSFKEEHIKLYHYVNGEINLFYQANLDYPNGFNIYKEEGLSAYYYLGIIAPNDNSNGSKLNPYETVTLLELNKNVIDTIKCKMEKGENSLVCKQIIYNGDLVWDWGDNTVKRFTIMK